MEIIIYSSGYKLFSILRLPDGVDHDEVRHCGQQQTGNEGDDDDLNGLHY